MAQLGMTLPAIYSTRPPNSISASVAKSERLIRRKSNWLHERRMDSRLIRVRNFSGLLLLSLAMPAVSHGQSAAAPPPGSEPRSSELVRRALATELSAARDSSHPMRYRLRKSSPRLTSTKEIIE